MANFNPYGYGYGYNNNFPYFNGNNNQPNYGNNFTQPQPQQQLNTYAFVNGLEGAKAYQVQPNQTMLLMDSDNPIAYMKTANAMGQSTLRYFKLIEINETELKTPQQKTSEIDPSLFASKKELQELAKKIDDLKSKLKMEVESNA